MKLINNPRSAFNCTALLFIFLVFIISGCKKDHGDDPPPVDPPDNSAPIPAPSLVHTTVTAFVASENAPIAQVTMGYGTENLLSFSNGGFTSKPGKFDQYETYISAGYVSGHEQAHSIRFVPVSNSIRNYIDMGMLRNHTIRSTPTGSGGGYFTLPNGGRIEYPNHSFSADVSQGIESSIIIFDPKEPTFVIANPAVTVDMDNQRWYLQSFGGVFFGIPRSFVNLKPYELEYVIPAHLLAIAPDSIEAFHLEAANNRPAWIKRGVAKKQGNAYKCSLPTSDMWCLGLRKKGMYKTFQVRLASGVPVMNAIVNIKGNNGDIGSARTDANGNAICFVPVKESFTITVSRLWTPSGTSPTLTVNAGPFSIDQSSPFQLTYPAGTTQLRVIKGKATTCEGAPVQNGYVLVTHHNYSDRAYYHIPVVNGEYSGALLHDPAKQELFELKLKDSTANRAGNDSAIIWKPTVEKIINLNTCQGPTNLYMDYAVDGVNYSIKGDASHPENPMLNFYWNGGLSSAMIVAVEENKHIEFNFPGSFTEIGTHPGGIGGIWVNHVLYQAGSGTITITRHDLLAGYVEGSLEVEYYDASSNTHRLTAKFRLFKFW